ncbi:hypothetical protein KKI19_04010, partial [Patescibacteria group bacterium]|nr:hypothetical protein [Patescibacteria group bacterium]
MSGDLLYILWWWLIWFILGLGFLPLTVLIFQDFFDKGYIFAKILGILFLSYTAWLLGSIKLLPFSQLSLFLILGLFLLINFKLLKLPKLLKLS